MFCKDSFEIDNRLFCEFFSSSVLRASLYFAFFFFEMGEDPNLQLACVLCFSMHISTFVCRKCSRCFRFKMLQSFDLCSIVCASCSSFVSPFLAHCLQSRSPLMFHDH